jgi:hypothetical protein
MGLLPKFLISDPRVFESFKLCPQISNFRAPCFQTLLILQHFFPNYQSLNPVFSNSCNASALLPKLTISEPHDIRRLQSHTTLPIFPVSKVFKHCQPPNEPLSFMLIFWCAANRIQVQTNNKAITVTCTNYTLGFRVCYPLMDRLWTHGKRECCDHTNKGHASCQSKKPRVIIIIHCANRKLELTVYIVKYWCYAKGDLVGCDTRLRIKHTRTHTHTDVKQYKVRNTSKCYETKTINSASINCYTA